MRPPRLLLLLALLVALPASAQIRLQVIHNAADPAAAAVDVYVNGDRVLDDFAFRSATPFLTLPSNTDLTIAIAPPTSTSAADAIFSQTFNLPVGTYQLIASGVLTPASFAPNPNGRSIAFQLVPGLNAREVAADPASVAIRVVHGATDAPTVNVRSEGFVIVGDITYPEVTANYWPLFPGVYPLDITLPNGDVVASFTADLSGAVGAAITVLASGFLAPAANQNGPAFGLLAVFADGTTALLPAAVPKARLQVIHNAADPGAAAVDVYVNGNLLLDDFAFRTATPFIDVEADVPLTVAIAPPTSTSAADAIFSETFTLPANSTTQLIANGVLTPGSFAANPDGRSTAFQLLVGADAREASDGTGEVRVRVVHGATDAPTVDVRTSNVTLVPGAAYGDITGYLAVPPADYVLDVAVAGGPVVASFTAPLAGAGGGAATVLASGFLTPSANQNGAAFGLLAVFPNGDAVLLPSAPISTEPGAADGRLGLSAPAPNPVADAATVAFSLAAPGRATLALYDVLGRRVAVLAEGTFAAERHEVRLDRRGLAAGAYVLRLETEAGMRTRTVTLAR